MTWRFPLAPETLKKKPFFFVRASPTEAPKRPRGKLTVGLPPRRARAFQWARKNERRGKTFAARFCAILRGKVAPPAAARAI
jgi:hypothetical protein